PTAQSPAPTTPTLEETPALAESHAEPAGAAEVGEMPAPSRPRSILVPPATPIGADYYRTAQTNGAGEERKVASPPIPSASRKLLAQLIELPPETLEGVERLTLQQYLSSPRFLGNESLLRAGLDYYWKSSKAASDYVYWTKRVNLLKALISKESAPGELLKTALNSAEMNQSCALVAMRAYAVETARQGGFAHEIWPQTPPHAGSYHTNYQHSDAYANTDLAYMDQIITLRYEQISRAAAAYRSAEYLLQEIASHGSSPSEILSALDEMNLRRNYFMGSVLEYNEEILDYVLRVSSRRGAELARYLAVSDPMISEEEFSPPVTPPVTVDEVRRAEASTPTYVSPGGTLAPPVLPETPPPSADETSPYLPNTEFEGTFSAPEPAPPIEIPGTLEETPPSGSGFTPIGGATGSTSTLPVVPPLPLSTPSSTAPTNPASPVPPPNPAGPASPAPATSPIEPSPTPAEGVSSAVSPSNAASGSYFAAPECVYPPVEYCAGLAPQTTLDSAPVDEMPSVLVQPVPQAVSQSVPQAVPESVPQSLSQVV
ncbi:MAG: hypothetical protein Q4D38_13845, partial [Planctomycetia bacterium]|nr:hypothetical protein [Planctomycetia bacterium]